MGRVYSTQGQNQQGSKMWNAISDGRPQPLAKFYVGALATVARHVDSCKGKAADVGGNSARLLDRFGRFKHFGIVGESGYLQKKPVVLVAQIKSSPS